MRLKGLMRPLIESTSFKGVLDSINKSKFPMEIIGLSDSGRSYFIDGLYENNIKSILVLTNSDVEAKNIYEDLSFYIPNVYYFPSKEVVFYNVYAISGDLRWERLKVIREMLREGKKIIVASIESIASAYISPQLYIDNTLKFSIGDTVDLDTIVEKLIQSGYERVSIVEGKGEFSIRGGILDVYPPISSIPYRIEFFGDEIDSIRSFNTESQRSIEKFNEIEIFPAK